jgi:hypothetical protein
MKKLLGLIMVLLGIVLGGWVGYNLLVQRLPEAQGKSPIPAIVFTVALLAVGCKWIAGR